VRGLLLFVCLALNAAAPAWEVGNRFAVAYGSWAKLRNERVNNPDTISVPEVAAWQTVKTAWRELEKAVDTEYRGER
jgi:hypothetical protein